MEFTNKLKSLAERIDTIKVNVTTEEATKHSFIMPFLGLLGYDVFDPTIVVPEFTADISKKKNEKVDYAIMHDNKPLILIEAKSHTENLEKHATQLERYFTVTDSKFAILTNGIEYRFFSDLEKDNKMDSVPFFTLDLSDLKDRDIKILEKFRVINFDIENIVASAGNKKYVSEIKNIFKEESKDPSDEFARLFANKLSDKVLRQNVIDEFKGYIKTAFSEVVSDMAQDKINALKSKLSIEINQESENQNEELEKDGIETTNDEIEGFFIIKSILAEKIELSRVHARDTKSYFGILLDDNNRKWICRLYFNTKQKYLSVHIEDKKEEKYTLENIEDIYKYKEVIINTLDRLTS